ncbi:MAG: ArsR family transcriptional regulator [Candidatus Asgardarchaeum californiense]|nr:MAG: ArsR family transcriptional regulator [Candidatus Asgardarchaeum californiense]
MNAVKRLLWWLLAGSTGGQNRGRLLEELFEQPHNANELAKVLNLDYKTIRHHIKLLEKNRLITSTGSGYGKIYFPSDLLEENKDVFIEIWERIGKNQIKKKGTNR